MTSTRMLLLLAIVIAALTSIACADQNFTSPTVVPAVSLSSSSADMASASLPLNTMKAVTNSVSCTFSIETRNYRGSCTIQMKNGVTSHYLASGKLDPPTQTAVKNSFSTPDGCSWSENLGGNGQILCQKGFADTVTLLN